MSVLNLPLEQQRALAKEMGLSYDAWVAKMKKSLQKITAYRPTTSKGNRSPESIARAAQIQARMDNETPS